MIKLHRAGYYDTTASGQMSLSVMRPRPNYSEVARQHLQARQERRSRRLRATALNLQAHAGVAWQNGWVFVYWRVR